MAMFYSAATNGFYPEDMRSMYDEAGTWPGDATEISDEDYETLMAGQANGKEIAPGDDGIPQLIIPEIDYVSETGAQKHLLLREAAEIIFPLTLAVKHGMATDEETARLEAWEKYSVLVSRVNPEGDWPERPD